MYFEACASNAVLCVCVCLSELVLCLCMCMRYAACSMTRMSYLFIGTLISAVDACWVHVMPAAAASIAFAPTWRCWWSLRRVSVCLQGIFINNGGARNFGSFRKFLMNTPEFISAVINLFNRFKQETTEMRATQAKNFQFSFARIFKYLKLFLLIESQLPSN